MKGAIAKENVINTITAAFGADYVGISDKKIYVWADDGNGERAQVAITLTCPKVPLNTNADSAFAVAAPTSGTEFQPAEITTEETENIKKLLAELGL